jgi:DNA-binding PadR family transcriptional regulator
MTDNQKLRFVILKEMDSGNKELTEDDLDINQETFDDTFRFLTREGYLKGIVYGDDRPQLELSVPTLTEKGERYLAENNELTRAYKALKELKSWIKL